MYTPSDIDEICGVSPDVLRKWRHLGYLEGVGDLGANGRWTYRRGHVLMIAVAKLIEKTGIDLGTALEIAINSVSFIVDEFEALRGAPRLHSGHRFILCWQQEFTNWDSPETANLPGRRLGAMNYVRLDDLNRISAYAVVGAVIVDVKSIASHLPATLFQADDADGGKR